MTSQSVRKNQFGDDVVGEDEAMTMDKWQQRWINGQTKFHVSKVHPMLEKHLESLTQGSHQLKIFLPLCGKSLDLNWLASLGLDVIGNEYVELACQQFFTENNIDYTVTELQDIPGKLYRSTDENRKVMIVCCDFYSLTRGIIGNVDGIWDRGSLAAIDRKDRTKYNDVICGLMQPSTRYLVDTFLVDHGAFAGPPHDMPDSEFQLLFGERCNISMLEERDAMTDWQRSWGVSYFTEQVRVLKLK